MKKIELNASMTVAEGFEDFVLNKKIKRPRRENFNKLEAG